MGSHNMEFLEQIEMFVPNGIQEETDKRLILEYIRMFPDTILARENTLVHMTSSGFVLTPGLEKALFVHHNIYQTWAWTGGHADGETDLLAVAAREVQEETGVRKIEPLGEGIAALDLLTVQGHFKKGAYVAPHLHISVAYVFLAAEREEKHFRKKEDENSGVQWIPVEEIAAFAKEPHMIPIYEKLLRRAREIRQEQRNKTGTEKGKSSETR